jgi:hypothetical protein
MVLIKSNDKTEAGLRPGPELFGEMMAYNQELAKAGVLLAGDGLHPSVKGARVRWSEENDITVVEGPFGGAEDLVAGYWMWQVESMAEAVEWAKRCPNHLGWAGVVELRQVFEAADWGDVFTPEMLAKAGQLRAG